MARVAGCRFIRSPIGGAVIRLGGLSRPLLFGPRKATVKKSQLKRLRAAMDHGRKKLKSFRNHRFEAIKQYVGSHYSDEGAEDKVPVNLLEMAVNIYMRQLAAQAPKALVTTRHKTLKAPASTLTLAIDHLADEIDLGRTLRRAVLHSLFGLGIVKVGISATGEVEIEGFLHDVGQPFADAIGLDDWVHDMSSRTF